eukprot:740161-Prymnesium_polylepis.1
MQSGRGSGRLTSCRSAIPPQAVYARFQIGVICLIAGFLMRRRACIPSGVMPIGAGQMRWRSAWARMCRVPRMATRRLTWLTG